jgi:hypothetical protein
MLKEFSVITVVVLSERETPKGGDEEGLTLEFVGVDRLQHLDFFFLFVVRHCARPEVDIKIAGSGDSGGGEVEWRGSGT